MPASRFSPYQNALKSLSARTGTPLPSLLFSFVVLHEFTAIVPLVGVFFASRQLGFGERVIGQLTRSDALRDHPDAWFDNNLSQWIDEGERWAERVGRRYGIFGFTKGQPLDFPSDEAQPGQISTKIAGDLANAVLAYGTVKALLPVRIGLSLYLSPAFSRRVVDPVRLRALRWFRNP
ncbi:hypothetical protein V8B97DRAFT_2023863 [Scleroderma yunnanense]